MKKLIVPLIVGIILIGGVVFLSLQKSTSSISSQSSSDSANSVSLTVTTSSEKSYTLADISTHSTSTDCYMAISGKIYDVTKYINSHPGGDVIVEGCGKDATELFTEERKHAGRAESLLPEFEIGILKQS